MPTDEFRVNPYAAPMARLDVEASDFSGIWRDGKILIASRDAVFPLRCVKCNGVAEPRRESYRMRWHHSAWYLLLFVIPLVLYALVALKVTRWATVHVGLCRRHHRLRAASRVVGWGGLAAIVVVLAVGIGFGSATAIGWSLLALLPWALVSMALSPQLIAVRIDEKTVRFRGCGREFLNSLPVYQHEVPARHVPEPDPWTRP
jgi:hypothetical protein